MNSFRRRQTPVGFGDRNLVCSCAGMEAYSA